MICLSDKPVSAARTSWTRGVRTGVMPRPEDFGIELLLQLLVTQPKSADYILVRKP